MTAPPRGLATRSGAGYAQAQPGTWRGMGKRKHVIIMALWAAALVVATVLSGIGCSHRMRLPRPRRRTVHD
jgi:hypothetical protein